MKSDAIKEGVQNAPHRVLFNSLGLTAEEQRRPLIGIVSSYNEIVPGHMNIDKITEAVKLGVAMAGGTPIVFPAIAVCDGIAMGHQGMKYSLVTRDLIADSTECMAMAHGFDALVMIPNCDKNVPGLLMAAARLNIPSIFVSGGPMLAGNVNGCKVSLSAAYEAVGAYAAGKINDEQLEEYEEKTCPTYMRFMFGYVYGKLNELSYRGSRNGSAWKRYNTGCVFRKNKTCQKGRHADYGAAQKEYTSQRYYDSGSFRECSYHRYGTRLQYKQYASSSCNRT